MDPPPSKSESVMESLLKNANITWKDFLETIWEHKCHRFAFGTDESETSTKNIWRKTVLDGWEVLTHMLDTTHPMCARNDEEPNNNNNNSTNEDAVSPPLLFRNLQPMDDPEEIRKSFGSSLYRAYLAGNSIVWNHADVVSPEVANLCQDLQRHFPHAYANAYLTPPHSQTVPAHADDRDVLVFQLVGKKHWTVYDKIPIPHPYPHQQVGKAGIPVPKAVTKGPKAFDGCLVPGDVLYLPRGMVHEANTDTKMVADPLQNSSDLSFHITVALATHDWTLGGNLGRMIQNKLSELPTSIDSIIGNNIRRSLLPTSETTNDSNGEESNQNLVPCGGSIVDAQALQKRLDNVFSMLSSQITAQSILHEMNQRIELHNAQATGKRRSLKTQQQQQQQQQQQETACSKSDDIVGPIAAKSVTLDTLLRAATSAEREHAQTMLTSASAAGLTVRDGVGDDVAAVVGAIKGGALARVGKFRNLTSDSAESSLCDLTAVSLAKRAVELGAFCIVNDDDEPNPKRQRTDI